MRSVASSPYIIGLLGSTTRGAAKYSRAPAWRQVMPSLPGKRTCNMPIQLYESSRAGLQAQAAAAASDVLRAGQKTLTFGLDNLGTIGDDTVAALILAPRQ